MFRCGEQVPVVGPDFIESVIEGARDVNRITGS
jgi:hypothetical protein